MLDALLELGSKKPWLMSQSAFVVAQAMPQMSRGEVEKTLAKVSDAGFAKTPEGLGIWLAASNAHPKLKLPKPWKHPLSSNSFQEVASVFKGSGKEPGDIHESRLDRIS